MNNLEIAYIQQLDFERKNAELQRVATWLQIIVAVATLFFLAKKIQ